MILGLKCATSVLLARAHWWPLIIRGHGSHLGDGDVGLEALDFHIIWFDGQVCLAMGDVEGAGGRALCLGQLVLLLACLALCGCKFKTGGHPSLGNRFTLEMERLRTILTPKKRDLFYIRMDIKQTLLTVLEELRLFHQVIFFNHTDYSDVCQYSTCIFVLTDSVTVDLLI